MNNNIGDNCSHTFAPLGMERIQTTENIVEVIACVFCTRCSLFRTKILYYNRNKDYKAGKLDITTV